MQHSVGYRLLFVVEFCCRPVPKQWTKISKLISRHLLKQTVTIISLCHIDETYSIDEIKGVRKSTEEEAKKPRRKKEPIERFTTEHLIQEKGIPELMIKGRRLYLRDKVTIVWTPHFRLRVAKEIGCSDADVSFLGSQRLRCNQIRRLSHACMVWEDSTA